MQSPFPSASAVDITDPESVPLSLLHGCSPVSSPNLGDRRFFYVLGTNLKGIEEERLTLTEYLP